jgi:hypothetical protein
MARHLPKATSLCHSHDEWCRQTRIDIQFYVPNLADGELAPLKRFVKDLLVLHSDPADDT